MKSYDDLQRFKEKTQTNHIEFKDMSEQTKNSDSANWAIIKQLMNDGAESALGNGQRIDVPAPQPIAEDTFTAPPVQTQAEQQPASLRPQPSVQSHEQQPASLRPQPAVQSHAQQPASLRPQPAAHTPAQSHSVASFVAKPAATQIGASLLDSISASLKPAPVAEPAQPAASAPVQAVNPFTETQAANPLDSAAAQQASSSAATQSAAVTNPIAAALATQPAMSPLMASLPTAPPAPVQAAPVRQPAAFVAPAQPVADLPRFKQLFSTAPEPSVTSLSKETLLQPLLERIASCR